LLVQADAATARQLEGAIVEILSKRYPGATC
jgi:hypothetical protein